MAHAQRLLPIEQLLSEASAAGVPPQARPGGRPSIVPENLGSSAPAQARGNFVSPFAADSARKTKPEMSSDAAAVIGPRIVANAASAEPVILGTAVMEPVEEPAASVLLEQAQQVAVVQASSSLDSVRNAVLNALGDAGHRMLLSMLETGEWSIEGSELVIKVTASATVIDMSVGADARRLAIATASGAMGRAVKFKVLPGGTAQAAPARPVATGNGGGRARAEQDPIVQRLREKFGAEIRTIIDQRDKK
jgi:hypothetical protein